MKMNLSLIPCKPITMDSWDIKQVQFLFRKIGYGISFREMNEFKKISPSKLIQRIINKAKKNYLPKPEWANWSSKKYHKINGELNEKLVEKHYYEFSSSVIENMLSNGFKSKLVLFWSNHFVTSFWEYENPVMLWKYYRLLDKNALGNFKDLVYAMGITPAMLVYLNGNENTAEKPNENYAREFLELFTLGVDNNYTQKDISEIAKAFSGFTIDENNNVEFNIHLHDHSEKTIFGRKGKWKYKNVIDILFEERKKEIAFYVCTEFYKFYVNDNIDLNVVNHLSEIFIHNNFELTPVVEELLLSEDFYKNKIVGTYIKSPLDLCLIFINEMSVSLNKKEFKELVDNCSWLGQSIFIPPNVAGWSGYRIWIDATKLTRRWTVLDWILYDLISKKEFREKIIGFVKRLTNEINDPGIISKVIVDYFLPKGLQSENDYKKSTNKFKGEWPEEVFDSNWWNLDRKDTEWQVTNLISYLFRMPEFHLI